MYVSQYKKIISLLLGINMGFAFAPYSYTFCAFFSLAVLLFMWEGSTPRQAGKIGLLFGLSFFGSTASWISISLIRFGGMHWALAALITFLFTLLLASFIAITGLLTVLFSRYSRLSQGFFFPTVWTLMEWVRGGLFSGFPWLFVGYLYPTGLLSGWAPLGGVYAVSWVVTACSALLIKAVRSTGKQRHSALATLLATLLLSAGLTALPWVQVDPWSPPLTVALIQGNIAQQNKWDPHALSSILTTYLTLSRPHWKKGTLIVWPEGALPTLPDQVGPWLSQLNRQAQRDQVGLFMGAPLRFLHKGQAHIYNGLLGIGQAHGVYRKRHLVPFGEYTPFQAKLAPLLRHWVTIPLSNLTAGPDPVSPVTFSLPGLAPSVSLAPLICFEIAFAELVRRSVTDAPILLVLTDDSWFGHTVAAAQHLQIAQMRARETGRPLILSSNNGQTALIGPDGQLRARALPFTATTLVGTLRPTIGQTPWLFIGEWGVITLLLCILGIALCKN